jgi:hypothetical protein
MKPTRFAASCDPSTAFLRVLSRYLGGKRLATVHTGSRIRSALRRGMWSAMPARFALEAVAPEKLSRVHSERVARWAVTRYPERRYPAVMIGSPSGALIHLCAALGAPWLPQTLAIAVRARVDPEDPHAARRFGEDVADRLLEPNPDFALHQTYDPDRDQRTAGRMICFQVKRIRIGDAYARFIREAVPPGGTIFVSDCRLRWPVTRVGRRHVFQMGEYGHGARLEAFPPGVESAPEAQWGFAADLYEDIEHLARRYDYAVRRIAFEQPEDLSPVIADLYRWWYELRGIPAERLVVESSADVDPWWMLRTGAVPFWVAPAEEGDPRPLDDYLAAAEPWRFVHTAAEKLPARFPIPGPLALEVLDDFLSARGGAHRVRWVEERRAGRAVRRPRAPSFEPAPI